MAESSTELIPPLIAEAKEAGQYKFLAAGHRLVSSRNQFCSFVRSLVL